MVGKPQSYMNTHIQFRSNLYLNAPIPFRSSLATPIGKTKQRKSVNKERKREKELTFVHWCQKIKRERERERERERD